MSDRVSACIKLGGTLPRAHLADFLDIIAYEGLSTQWDGAPFECDDMPVDAPLELMATEVPGGSFDRLEDFCIRHELPFARCCNGYPGQWSGERLVFDGHGATRAFQVTDDDHVVIGLAEIKALGSMAAIEAHFASADIMIPPLKIAEREADHG